MLCRVELNAERNDQLTVADPLTTARDDGVDRGLDGNDGVADPVRAPGMTSASLRRELSFANTPAPTSVDMG